MEEKESNKINQPIPFSFKNLFVNITKKWIITLIVGVITLVLSFTGLFLYSKNNNTFVSKFQMEWPGIENQQYPNGKPFNYKTIISKENLQKAVNSNKELNNVNIDEMFSNNGIQIEQEVNEKVHGNSSRGYNYIFTITIDKKYFEDSSQASLFVETIVGENTFNVAKNEITNYKMLNYFKSQDENTQYSETISNIDNQVSLQRKTLNKIINSVSLDFVYDEENQYSLGDLVIDYNSFFKNNDYKILESEMLVNNYVKNESTYKEEFTNRVAAIDLKIKENDRKITALTTSFNGNYGQETVPQMLAELVLDNEDLKTQKIYYENCLNETDPSKKPHFDKDFDDNVNKYQSKVEEFNTQIEKAYIAVNEPKTVIEYNKNHIITEEGFGLFKIGIFSIIITVIIEFIYSLILTLILNKKQNA